MAKIKKNLNFPLPPSHLSVLQDKGWTFTCFAGADIVLTRHAMERLRDEPIFARPLAV